MALPTSRLAHILMGVAQNNIISSTAWTEKHNSIGNKVLSLGQLHPKYTKVRKWILVGYLHWEVGVVV